MTPRPNYSPFRAFFEAKNKIVKAFCNVSFIREQVCIASFIIVMLTWGCQNKDKSEINPVFEDPDWIKLEIPNGREAYAIVGDIEKTLLVATWTKVYSTFDKGKTWQESKDFQGPVMGLLQRNDTIFSLKASGNNQNGQPYASLAQYFTIDFGRNWLYCGKYFHGEEYAFYSELSQSIGVARTAVGLEYRIKQNYTPVSLGSSSFYINPSEIQKEDNLGSHTLRFPFKHRLMNLYLDANYRLYVAASGGTFNQNNDHYCCEDKMPAIVYVSKKPLP